MKRFVYAVLAALLLLFIARGVKNVEAKSTYNPDAYENSDELYKNGDINERYYDKDGSDYTIDDYHTQLFAKNISGTRSINEYNVLADDPIINIIPKEYFETIGDYSADGKEYYYYIRTTKEVGYLNALVGGKTGNCYKNVLIYVNYEQVCDETIVIEGYENKEKDTFSHILEIHQFIFYTLDLTQDGVYWPALFAPMRNKLSVSKGISNKSVVIPAPTFRANDYVFREKDSHFWIQDIACAESIINTHDENQNNGLFLISAEKLENATQFSLSQEPEENPFVQLFVETITKFVPYYSQVSTIISVYNYTKGFIDLFREEDEELEYITQAELVSKSRINFWSNKLDQLREGDLIKNYIMYLEDFALGSNGQVQFNFRYSSDTSDQYKLGAMIQTDFIYSVGCDGEILEMVHHTNKMEVVNGKDFDTIKVKPQKEGYNYGETSEKYIFEPSTTGVYNFTVDNNQILRLYDENFNIININTELVKDNTYYVEVYNPKSTPTYYKLEIKSLSDLVEVNKVDTYENGNDIVLDITFEHLDKYSIVVNDKKEFIIDSDKHCKIEIPKNYIYTSISYFGLLPDMYVKVNDKVTIDLILKDSINDFIRSQDYISNHYEEIISSLEKPGLWYNVNTEIAFLAMLYLYEEDVWISFDDGINNDSYMIDDAQTMYFKLQRDLDFKGYSFKMPYRVYLYGGFDGANHKINNLKLDSSFKHFYIENYGTFRNVVFKNCEIDSIFRIESDYGEYINVRFE